MDINFNEMAEDLIGKHYDKIKKRKIDLIVGGGGFAVMYVIGFLYYVKVLERMRKLKLCAFSTASAGGLAIQFYKMDIDEYVKIRDHCQELELSDRYLLDSVYTLLDSHLPRDIHRKLNNKLHIATTTFSIWNFPYFFKREIYSTFKNREDFIHTFLCSCVIPGVTHPGIGKYYNGKYHLDGVVPETDFGDCQDKLYINLFNVKTLAESRFKTGTKGEVEGLVIRGLHDAHLFFTEDKETPTMYWHKPWRYKDMTTFAVENAKSLYWIAIAGVVALKYKAIFSGLVSAFNYLSQ